MRSLAWSALVGASFLLFSLNASPANAQQPGPRTYVDFKVGPISPGELPTNWNGYTLDDAFNQRSLALIDEIGHASGLTFRFHKPSSGASAGAQNQPIPTTVAPIGPPDVTQFGENLTLQQAGEALEIIGLVPNLKYDFWLLTWAYRANFAQPMNLSVSGVSGLSQIITPENTFLAINGVSTDTSHTFSSYATRVTALPSGQMTIQTNGGSFTGVYGLAIQPIPEPASALAAAGVVLLRISRRRRS